MKKIVLHICCGPCASGSIPQLFKEIQNNPILKNAELIAHFSNDNLDSKEEFDLRLTNSKIVCTSHNLNLSQDHYSPKEWEKIIKGLENEKEGGKRCFECIKYRMEKTAQYANKNNIIHFSTSLSISPFKDYEMIKRIAKDLEKKYHLKFIDIDFKSDEGYKKSIAESKRLNLYRQKYCGCKFSKKNIPPK